MISLTIQGNSFLLALPPLTILVVIACPHRLVAGLSVAVVVVVVVSVPLLDVVEGSVVVDTPGLVVPPVPKERHEAICESHLAYFLPLYFPNKPFSPNLDYSLPMFTTFKPPSCSSCPGFLNP